MQFPVDVGPQYEGERIRKGEYYAEFGGPAIRHKFELCTIKPLEEVEHEKITIIGPDIKELKEEGSYPLAILIDVAGRELEKDMEPVLERRIHQYINYIEGFWHIASRDLIWLRLSKTSFKKGLNSFEWIGRILFFLYTSDIPIIEKISATFITDEDKVIELLPYARSVYQARDERLKGLTDEMVDEFYGCTLCQSFAPTHVCIITPEKPSLCGAISWLDGKAAYKLDPYGAQFRVDKGELLDPVRYEFSGVNAIVYEKSMGANSRFYLHSAFEYPTTSCGCFQGIVFYIPEVDAFGFVHRDFVGPTVVGIPFSTMAGEASGGRQREGYLGIAIDYLRSKKFLQADGGLYRMVWMPKDIKERIKDAIPADLYDKIATEKDVSNIEELIKFLQDRGHPWVKGEVKLSI